jgi:hypothetical protein
MFPDEFSKATLAPVPPDDLSGEQIDKALALADVIETWAKAVRQEAFNRLDKGVTAAPTSVKLVMGNEGNRKWKDPDVVPGSLAHYFKDVSQMYQPAKPLAPAPMKKALKAAIGTSMTAKEVQAIIDQYVTRAPAKKVMVASDDPRQAVAGSIDSMFD